MITESIYQVWKKDRLDKLFIITYPPERHLYTVVWYIIRKDAVVTVLSLNEIPSLKTNSPNQCQFIPPK